MIVSASIMVGLWSPFILSCLLSINSGALLNGGHIHGSAINLKIHEHTRPFVVWPERSDVGVDDMQLYQPDFNKNIYLQDEKSQ